MEVSQWVNVRRRCCLPNTITRVILMLFILALGITPRELRFTSLSWSALEIDVLTAVLSVYVLGNERKRESVIRWESHHEQWIVVAITSWTASLKLCRPNATRRLRCCIRWWFRDGDHSLALLPDDANDNGVTSRNDDSREEEEGNRHECNVDLPLPGL